MTLYKPKQRYLLSREAVFDLEPLRKYEQLSENQIIMMGITETVRIG
jgi:hypothetical protein